MNDTPLESDSMGQPPRKFGAFAYERVLTQTECLKLERVERRIASSLDDTIHVWVRDARSFAHRKESAIEPLTLRLHPSLPVAEVRDRIQERYTEVSSYRPHVDGPLQLMLDGRALEDGKLLAEYLSHDDGAKEATKRQRLRRWPTPFAGILWVVPFRPATSLAPAMWAGAATRNK